MKKFITRTKGKIRTTAKKYALRVKRAAAWVKMKYNQWIHLTEFQYKGYDVLIGISPMVFCYVKSKRTDPYTFKDLDFDAFKPCKIDWDDYDKAAFRLTSDCRIEVFHRRARFCFSYIANVFYRGQQKEFFLPFESWVTEMMLAIQQGRFPQWEEEYEERMKIAAGNIKRRVEERWEKEGKDKDGKPIREKILPGV